MDVLVLLIGPSSDVHVDLLITRACLSYYDNDGSKIMTVFVSITLALFWCIQVVIRHCQSQHILHNNTHTHATASNSQHIPVPSVQSNIL